MHFQCKLQDLIPAINLVEKAVATQSNIEIITGIHIKTEQDKVILTSTNLELGIQTSFNAHITKQNEIVVDGKLLSALIRKLPNQPIIFELDDNQLVITAGTVEFALNILIEEDFPELANPDKKLFAITGELLLKMIKNTIYACGKDDKRPFLNGLLVEMLDSKLNFVATDINRLAFYSSNVNLSDVDSDRFLVPMKTFQELQKSIPNDETIINVSTSDNQLIFEYDQHKITTRLIDDKFPNYVNLFPKEEPIEITVNRQMLTAAVERASLINSDDGSHYVIFDVENGVLEIRTPSSSKGKSQEQINVEHQGENGKAAFSAKYILEMLKATDAEQVIFGFNSDLRQCLLRPDNEENQKYILMPIRI